MSLQRWRQIEELYHSACEHGLAVLADADPEIRSEVEKLLAVNSESGAKLLDQRAEDLITDLADTQITPGSSLGPYRIEGPLGQGGMGRVFRASDTRLGRPVAIKICKQAFIDRFEQESRSIAAISHPNVCTLYDVGPNYLVMELVEGETLAARLKRGKLSIHETLRFGSQIAEALAVAHARGIVHRDLKPANVMMAKTGVKVLDFGLARSSADPALTEPGHVIGTPAYMAPERAEGKEVDARADIYALGLILAEMITGRFSRFPRDLPPALERVISRCLEADPDERWQSASDLKWELESIVQTGATALPVSRSRFPAWALVIAAVASIALVVFAVLRFGRQPAPPLLARMSIVLPEKSRTLSLAVSPDGRFIAVVLVKDGKQLIWIRALDSAEMKPLAGTDGAADPFWSPDSHFVAFFADSRLKKIDRSGGPVQTLCGALGALGGTWNRDGVILIGALWKPQTVSDAGGKVTDLPGHTVTELYPSFLPDGHHYIATRETGVWLGSIDDPGERRILPDASSAQVLAPPSSGRMGAVLFARAGTLTALPFDLERLEAAGEPYPVADAVLPGSTMIQSLASPSFAGVLAWVSGPGRYWQYVWRNRQGKDLGSAGEANSVAMISPDGKRVLGDHLGGGMWIHEFATGVDTRLGIDPGMSPVWSPDGKYVAWYRNGAIYRQAVDGAGENQILLKTDHFSLPKDWSSDGRYIIYAQVDAATGSADLFAFPVDGHGHPQVLADTPANEGQGEFSPDGHWVAYTSNESGLSEIYVIPFPPVSNGGRWMVSRGGGVQPRWSRDGKELFYISPDWTMMAAPVSTAPVFHAGTPQPLFNTEMVDTGIRTGPTSWDVAPDGKRFLIISDKSQETTSLNVILNWRPQESK